jgi:hypothetical protein
VCVYMYVCVSSRLAYIYCHQPELLASMVCRGIITTFINNKKFNYFKMLTVSFHLLLRVCQCV